MPIDKQRDILAFKSLVSGNITELTDNEVQVDAVINTTNLFYGSTTLKRIDTSRLSFGDYCNNVFQECTELEYVRLVNVEKIPTRGFYGCTKLQEISLPLLPAIPNYAFSGCTALTTLNLPSITKIGDNAFYNCKALSSINLPTVSIISSSAFQSCQNLASVTLQGITIIGSSCFSYCNNLDTIDLGASATSIESGAIKCSNLLHLVIRNISAVCAYGATVSGADPSNSQLKIYVPRALLDSYKTATNWSRLADKFVALEDHTVDGTTTGELAKE